MSIRSGFLDLTIGMIKKVVYFNDKNKYFINISSFLYELITKKSKLSSTMFVTPQGENYMVNIYIHF